jgi:hypothetical protein
LRTFSLARFQLRCHSARCARTPSDAEVRPKRDAQFPRFPSTRVRDFPHPRERRGLPACRPSRRSPSPSHRKRCFWPLP